MKKLVILFAVLALTAPLMAQTVTITVTDEGNRVARVDYNATNAGAIVAGLGFTVTLDHGIISAISNYQTGVNTPSVKGYGIYPGSVDINTSGAEPVVNSWGTPIDLTNAAGTGIGFAVMHIAMGTLYEAGNQPALTGTLFKFTVDCQGSGTPINVAIAGDPVRAGSAGGVVLINGTNIPIYTTGGTIGCLCFNGTPTEVAAWIAWGKPASWCGPCWRCGDVNGDCVISFGDVSQVFNDFKTLNTTGRSDVNMDGVLSFGDVSAVFNKFKTGATCTGICAPCP